MEFVVRLATAEDLDAVARVTLEAYCEDGFISPDDDYVEELADAVGRYRDAEVWVAASHGAVLGSVTFCSSGTPYAELARADEGEFRMLGVTRTARRQGVAEALVTRCIERSRELGHHAVVMCSMREMAPAHRLYARLGFHRLPERDWSPVSGIDLVAFARPAEPSRIPAEPSRIPAEPSGNSPQV